jgi:hypothetical protein
MDAQNELENALAAQHSLQASVESLLTIITDAAIDNPAILAKKGLDGETALGVACKHSKEHATIKDLARLYPDDDVNLSVVD